MDNSKNIRDFLMCRRARITPAQAGLPAFGGTRRVPGLKRDEAERVHLFDLAKAAAPSASPSGGPRRTHMEVRPSTQRIGEDLTLIAYTAEPGSNAQEQLDFLASWNTAHPVSAESPSNDSADRSDQPR